jgi:hypothetical protein
MNVSMTLSRIVSVQTRCPAFSTMDVINQAIKPDSIASHHDRPSGTDGEWN